MTFDSILAIAIAIGAALYLARRLRGRRDRRDHCQRCPTTKSRPDLG